MAGQIGGLVPAAGGAAALRLRLPLRLQRVEGRRALGALAVVLPVVLALYDLFDKGFAYVRAPGSPVYSGELVVGLVLAVTVVATPRVRFGLARSGSLVVLLVLVLWGLVRAIPGFAPWGLDAARDSALWYYAIIAFGVCALCVWSPGIIERWGRQYLAFVPVVLLWSLPAIALAGVGRPHVPFSDITVFAHRAGNIAVQAATAMSALWLLPLGPRLRRVRMPLLGLGVLVILVAGTQNRGGLVAAVAGLGVCFVLGRGRLRLLSAAAAAGVLVLAVGWATDINLPGPQGREISSSQLVTNVSSIGGGSTSGNLSATVAWRNQLWSTAIAATVERGQLIDGWGFGINVAKVLGSPEALETPPLRSPHNSHLDILVRLGVIGGGLWVLFWLGWYAQIAGAYRRLRDPADRMRRGVLGVVIAGVTATLVNAFFDPTLESPPVAVWLWTMAGLGVGIAVVGRRIGGGARA